MSQPCWHSTQDMSWGWLLVVGRKGHSLSWIERTKPGREMGILNKPSSTISCKLQQGTRWLLPKELPALWEVLALCIGPGSRVVAPMAKQNSVFAKQKHREDHLQHSKARLDKLEPSLKGREGVLSVTLEPLMVAGLCSVCSAIRGQKPQIFLVIKAPLLNQLLSFSSCGNHCPAQAEFQCSLLTSAACFTLISADHWS